MATHIRISLDVGPARKVEIARLACDSPANASFRFSKLWSLQVLTITYLLLIIERLYDCAPRSRELLFFSWHLLHYPYNSTRCQIVYCRPFFAAIERRFQSLVVQILIS